MNTRILDIIKNPELINNEDLPLLQSEIEKFPYMQSLRAIYLLGVHQFYNDDFQKELTKTAAYTTDKKILYNIINPNKIEPKTQKKEEKIEAETPKTEEKPSEVGVEFYTKSISTEKDELDNSVVEENNNNIKQEVEETEKPHHQEEVSNNIGIHFYTKNYTPSQKQEEIIPSQQNKIKAIETPKVEEEKYHHPMKYYSKPIAIAPKIENNTNEEQSWKPMQVDIPQPISKQNDIKEEKERENTILEEHNEEVITTIKEEIIPLKIENKVEHQHNSNISSFINTWQNWLKIDRTPQISEQEKKAAIIDKFIENNPKISPIKEDVEFVVKEKSDDISHLMTETLAQLYLEQKLYTKAINAYKILQEKHPEKEEEFEQKIENIKQIRHTK